MYIKDASLLIAAMNRFLAYIQDEDKKVTGIYRDRICFTDSSSLIGREEDFKYECALKGREVLQVKKWEKSWIGTGKIAALATKAIDTAGNLVYPNQKFDFKNRLNPNHANFKPNAEQVLYELYCGDDPEHAFPQAVKTFGAKYDTIAYLFFMKDYERFLPICPGHFDSVFKSMGISFTTSYHCSWENYNDFIAIIDEVKELMNLILPIQGEKVRLIDAHSFLWFINQKRMWEWEPGAEISARIEIRTEECLAKVSNGQPKKKLQHSLAYERNAEVVKRTRQLANGTCQLCLQPAPFKDKKGFPYLEVHHVIWLSRNGADDITNTVALCPNCHAKMHIVDDVEDIDYLRKIALTHK